jgi:2'-5' RNA ligase
MQGAFAFYRDLPVRPKRPERLFFGIFPPSDTAARVERFRERFVSKHRLAGEPLRAERLHISLHHVGDYRRLRGNFLYAAKRAGKVVSVRRFNITFSFVASFESAPSSNGRPRRRPLVLLGRGAALFDLHKTLGSAMEENGLRAAEDFIPHMTLFYGAEQVPAQPIEPICFAVEEFALIHSELWLSQYNVLDRWPLAN